MVLDLSLFLGFGVVSAKQEAQLLVRACDSRSYCAANFDRLKIIYKPYHVISMYNVWYSYRPLSKIAMVSTVVAPVMGLRDWSPLILIKPHPKCWRANTEQNNVINFPPLFCGKIRTIIVTKCKRHFRSSTTRKNRLSHLQTQLVYTAAFTYFLSTCNKLLNADVRN